MNSLPCKNCICLAICRSKYHSFEVEMRFQRKTPLSHFLNHVEDKCSLISDYIYDQPTADIIERMDAVEDYMKEKI